MNIPESIQSLITQEADASIQKKFDSLKKEGADTDVAIIAARTYSEGLEAGAQFLYDLLAKQPGVAILEENDAVAEVTAIMREADQMFQTTGGSTRHYVRDLLLPLLEQKGFFICKKTEPTPPPSEPLVEALHIARKALKESYDVQYHPGDGTSDCDKAIKVIDEALSKTD